MPTHEELARFLRRFNSLTKAVRLAFIAAALELAEDLGDRGFDPTSVRPSLRLHKLHGENVWSISFAGQHRAVFQLGRQQLPGHAHIVWEFIGTHGAPRRDGIAQKAGLAASATRPQCYNGVRRSTASIASRPPQSRRCSGIENRAY